MKLIFNELSFQPFDELTLIERFLTMLSVFEEAKKNYGFTHIVFPTELAKIKVCSGKTFYEWAFSISHKGNKNKILGFIQRPFNNDMIEGQINALNAYFFQNETLGIELCYCIGLATAHITDFPSLSIDTHSFWKQERIPFLKDNSESGVNDTVFVYNLADIETLEKPVFQTFAKTLTTIELKECDILPEEKTIRLRDDHGKDILTAFAKKIVNSIYVISIINSLPFNPHKVKFIRKVHHDGKIELVLYWEDEGYGLIIQTTGCNLRETEKIAEILKNTYDK